jgi:hypothetical protein
MDRLLELQEIDTAIDRLEQRRRQVEEGRQMEAARAELEAAERTLGEIRLALDSIAREQSRLEQEIESLTARADAEQKRLYDGSIANAKELEALQREVANVKERRSRAEDELLEDMVRREELEARAAEAGRKVAEARSRVDAIGAESDRELKEIEAEMGAKRSAREALAPQLDAGLLELYEDLRRQKDGVGAAAIVDGVCQACHEKLSAVELDRLKRTDDVKRCEYCRRIVVFV